MKIFTEKEAEAFLVKEGFDVFEGVYVKNERGISELEKLGFPLVAKASGKKIVHKKKIGGIVLGINNEVEALNALKKLKKINGCEEILYQRKAKGREFFLGIKKTQEFGHVLVFGKGGSAVEKEKDVSFKVCPVDKEDVLKMIGETKIGKTVSQGEKKKIEEILFLLCSLIKKYPKISELDINPLMEGRIIDARIVWD